MEPSKEVEEHTGKDSVIYSVNGEPMTLEEATGIIEELEDERSYPNVKFKDVDEVYVDGRLKHYQLKALLVVMEGKLRMKGNT